MNRAFRLVWSKRLNALVVASEITKGRGKGGARSQAITTSSGEYVGLSSIAAALRQSLFGSFDIKKSAAVSVAPVLIAGAIGAVASLVADPAKAVPAATIEEQLNGEVDDVDNSFNVTGSAGNYSFTQKTTVPQLGNSTFSSGLFIDLAYGEDNIVSVTVNGNVQGNQSAVLALGDGPTSGDELFFNVTSSGRVVGNASGAGFIAGNFSSSGILNEGVIDSPGAAGGAIVVSNIGLGGVSVENTGRIDGDDAGSVSVTSVTGAVVITNQQGGLIESDNADAIYVASVTNDVTVTNNGTIRAGDASVDTAAEGVKIRTIAGNVTVTNNNNLSAISNAITVSGVGGSIADITVDLENTGRVISTSTGYAIEVAGRTGTGSGDLLPIGVNVSVDLNQSATASVVFTNSGSVTNANGSGFGIYGQSNGSTAHGIYINNPQTGANSISTADAIVLIENAQSGSIQTSGDAISIGATANNGTAYGIYAFGGRSSEGSVNVTIDNAGQVASADGRGISIYAYGNNQSVGGVVTPVGIYARSDIDVLITNSGNISGPDGGVVIAARADVGAPGSTVISLEADQDLNVSIRNSAQGSISANTSSALNSGSSGTPATVLVEQAHAGSDYYVEVINDGNITNNVGSVGDGVRVNGQNKYPFTSDGSAAVLIDNSGNISALGDGNAVSVEYIYTESGRADVAVYNDPNASIYAANGTGVLVNEIEADWYEGNGSAAMVDVKNYSTASITSADGQSVVINDVISGASRVDIQFVNDGNISATVANQSAVQISLIDGYEQVRVDVTNNGSIANQDNGAALYVNQIESTTDDVAVRIVNNNGQLSTNTSAGGTYSVVVGGVYGEDGNTSVSFRSNGTMDGGLGIFNVASGAGLYLQGAEATQVQVETFNATVTVVNLNSGSIAESGRIDSPNASAIDISGVFTQTGDSVVAVTNSGNLTAGIDGISVNEVGSMGYYDFQRERPFRLEEANLLARQAAVNINNSGQIRVDSIYIGEDAAYRGIGVTAVSSQLVIGEVDETVEQINSGRLSADVQIVNTGAIEVNHSAGFGMGPEYLNTTSVAGISVGKDIPSLNWLVQAELGVLSGSGSVNQIYNIDFDGITRTRVRGEDSITALVTVDSYGSNLSSSTALTVENLTASVAITNSAEIRVTGEDFSLDSVAIGVYGVQANGLVTRDAASTNVLSGLNPALSTVASDVTISSTGNLTVSTFGFVVESSGVEVERVQAGAVANAYSGEDILSYSGPFVFGYDNSPTESSNGANLQDVQQISSVVDVNVSSESLNVSSTGLIAATAAGISVRDVEAGAISEAISVSIYGGEDSVARANVTSVDQVTASVNVNFSGVMNVSAGTADFYGGSIADVSGITVVGVRSGSLADSVVYGSNQSLALSSANLSDFAAVNSAVTITSSGSIDILGYGEDINAAGIRVSDVKAGAIASSSAMSISGCFSSYGEELISGAEANLTVGQSITALVQINNNAAITMNLTGEEIASRVAARGISVSDVMAGAVSRSVLISGYGEDTSSDAIARVSGVPEIASTVVVNNRGDIRIDATVGEDIDFLGGNDIRGIYVGDVTAGAIAGAVSSVYSLSGEEMYSNSSSTVLGAQNITASVQIVNDANITTTVDGSLDAIENNTIAHGISVSRVAAGAFSEAIGEDYSVDAIASAGAQRVTALVDIQNNGNITVTAGEDISTGNFVGIYVSGVSAQATNATALASVSITNAGNITSSGVGIHVSQVSAGDESPLGRGVANVSISNSGTIVANLSGVEIQGVRGTDSSAVALVNTGNISTLTSNQSYFTVNVSGVGRNTSGADPVSVSISNALNSKIEASDVDMGVITISDVSSNTTKASVTITNQGTLIGRVAIDSVAGDVTLTNSGTWQVKDGGASLLAFSSAGSTLGGVTTINNSGAINLYGNSTFAGMNDFVNSGVVNVTLDSGAYSRVDLDFIGSTYTAQSGATFVIDSFLGNSTAPNISRSDLFVFSSQDANGSVNITGTTNVRITDANSSFAGLNSPTGPVVIASVNDENTPLNRTAGTLVGGGTPYFKLENGPINKGLWQYDLFESDDVKFNVTTGALDAGAGEDRVWRLASTPSNHAFELPVMMTAAQEAWHRSAQAMTDRFSELRAKRDDASSPKSGMWAKVIGSTQERDLTNSYRLPSGHIGNGLPDLRFNTNYDQTIYGLMLGLDGVVNTGDDSRWLLGISAGIVQSDTKFDTTGTKMDNEIATVGLYASYQSGGAFFNALIKNDSGDTDYSMSNARLNRDAGIRHTDTFSTKVFGGALEGGYRFTGPNGFFEPSIRIATAKAKMQDKSFLATAVDFEDSKSTRSSISLASGYTTTWNGSRAEPYVQFSLINESDAENRVRLTSGGQSALTVRDGDVGTQGQLAFGLRVFGSKDSHGFIRAEYTGNSDINSYSISGGLKWHW